MEDLSNADLLKSKDDIEKKIRDQFVILECNGNVGMDAPLIDKDGFPRSDIDVYAVRQARNQVICLRNDHKQIMKLIESRIHEVHSTARERGTVSTKGTSSTTGVNRQPFATITMVTEGSPAAISGLCVGDNIIEFGSVNDSNFTGIQDIGNVVQHSEGRSVRVVLTRSTTTASDRIISLSITPHKWSGRGLLGCTIVPCNSTV